MRCRTQNLCSRNSVLEPEQARRNIMAIRRHFGIDRTLVMQLAVAIVILAVTPVSAAQHGTMSPRCAVHDLDAIDVIERLSRLSDPPNAWLAEAGFDFLQARTHCLTGDEERAVGLYEGITAGALIWG